MAGFHEFSPLDEIIPPLFSALILCFPCLETEKRNIFSILQDALSFTVSEMPSLAGEIVRISEQNSEDNSSHRPGHLFLKVPEPFVEPQIILNDLSLPGSGWKYTYEELRAAGMPMSKLDGQTLAPLAGIGKTPKVMAAQVNFIPGGCLFSVCFSHAFTDAYGIYLIMATWARNCRRLQTDLDPSDLASQTQPSIKVAKLPQSLGNKILWDDYEKLKHRPELWRLLGLDWRKRQDALLVAPYQTAPITTTKMFSFAPGDLIELKKSAKPSSSDIPPGGVPWVSTNDALVGFLWLSIMKARFPSTPHARYKEDSYTSVAIDGRKALSISPSFVGNVVFCSMTKLPISFLVANDTSLAAVASSIRTDIEANKNPERIREAVALAACIPDVRSLRNAFKSWFAEDLATTSLVDLPFYSLNFGAIFGETGHFEFFRMPEGQFNGLCCIQPRQGDGTVDVVISLESEQMNRLGENGEFTKYTKFVCE